MTRFLPSRALLACCGVTALLWAAIAFFLAGAEEGAFRNAAAALRNLARGLAEYERASVQGIDLSLRFLRDDWVRDRAGFAASVARHEAHLWRERIVQVAVIDREGWLLYSKLPQAQRLNFADREYFKTQRARGTDELEVSSPVFGRITRQWAIQYSRPLLDAAGNFDGLIVVAVPPPALEAIYKDFALGDGGIIALVRHDGTVLARSVDLEKAASVSLAGQRGLDPAEPISGEFRGRARVDGIERLLAWRKVEGHPLTVYVGQSIDTVLAPYREERRFAIAGGVVATLLLFALAVLLTARARERAAYLEARERLMLDLHDGCIQSIYAIGMSLENARPLVEREPARAARAIADAGASLNLVIQDLRAFIAGDVAAEYSDDEFVQEMEKLLPELDRGPSFTLALDRQAIRRLGRGQAEHVLRIAREAVSNVVRHAGARSARISLSAGERVLRLEVVDDGAGVPEPAGAGLGLGLNHIQARARKLGGAASIARAPGGGTRLAVEWPAAR